MEQKQDRQAQYRLAVLRHAEEVTGNVARTCRYYGISRPTFYKWRRRYQDEGLAGLRDRSSAPHHCPNATHADIVNKIVYLRQNYHFGPVKIQMYLKRYHDITITSSAIYNILVRLGLNRLPASQRYTSRKKRWKRYEKPLPGNRLQMDVKFIEPIGVPAGAAPTKAPITGTLPKQRRRARCYQFTAIDDCTRLRVLRIYPRCDQKTAIQFLDYVLQRLPFRVEVIQADNGAEFQTAFHWHVLDKGIAHTYIKPASPHLNGNVERSHRIDAEEFYRMLDGVVIDDTGVFNDKLREWEDYYNYHRPHGALDGQTPYERLKQKTQTQL
ncbi:IS481 family transposase [Actinoplanes sp. NPDC051343]|uniref:IS481 family transposase n=1 Tax=Actinoplanes sp. NPDC051343 TaxID=3363906 RepID=UPI0037AB9429